MSKADLDVVGIGNAIVDVLSKTTDAFLDENSINKGTMTLIDAPQVEKLYAKMGPGMAMSGGSAANTIAALASLGAKSGYIGKVAHDQLGDVFRHDIQSLGVKFDTPPLIKVAPTARCLILITPDAQRTMCTFLGACTHLTPDDISEEMVRNAKVTYLEGYLFDPPHAKAAFRYAAELAHKAGKKVALTLSDPFCVERHREEFLDLVKNHVDILFANEAEITALYQLSDFNEIVNAVGKDCEIAAITRSAKGSVIVASGKVIEVVAEPIDRVIDTTGAGDLYAAGFLFGYTQGKAMDICGRMGSIAAAEIIAQVGARPQRSLMQLMKDKGVL